MYAELPPTGPGSAGLKGNEQGGPHRRSRAVSVGLGPATGADGSMAFGLGVGWRAGKVGGLTNANVPAEGDDATGSPLHASFRFEGQASISRSLGWFRLLILPE